MKTKESCDLSPIDRFRRGSVIGFFVGIIPGGGAVISPLASYAIKKKYSKHPEEFGHGEIKAVAGPESANNAASSASFIPLLTLGIPENAAISMIFAALMIQGITPRPFLVAEHPDVLGGHCLDVHWKRDAPRVESPDSCALDADAPRPLLDSCTHHRPVHNDRRLQFPESGLRHLFNTLLRHPRLRDAEAEFRPDPAAAFVLGPMVERSLRQSLLIFGGDLTIFVSRPISGTLIAIFALLIVGQTAFFIKRKMIGKKTTAT